MTTRKILIALGIAAALAAGAGIYSSAASAQEGPGYGPRMMDDYGPSYDRGPGWRRGYGPGYRHMLRYGRGWRGEFCPGYGRGYGRWMMGW
jgi:hypothetical protein